MSNIPSVAKTGYDTWIDSNQPHKPYGSTDWVRVQGGGVIGPFKRGLLWLPIPARVRGRTIVSATLTGHAHGTLDPQTLSFTAVTDPWKARKVTWGASGGPAVTGAPATLVIGSPISDGGEFVVDFKSLVQQVADGTVTHRGWRISNNATTPQYFASFDSGMKSWRLDITYSDNPDVALNLAPNGTVVSVPLPIATFDFVTYGGVDGDIAKINFQIDVGNNGSVDYDSGWVSATVAQAELATSGLTVTAGTVVAYRIRVQDAGTQQSDWSDWATYTYQPLPTLTIDSPAGGVLYDPTSDVLAHIDASNLDAYRIWVTDGDDSTDLRYDSGKTQADDPSQIAFTLPLTNSDDPRGSLAGRPLFADDQDYQIKVRAFDDYDREDTPDSKSYVEQTVTVHFDDDLALDPVSSFQAMQVDQTPFTKLTWTDVAAADAYIVTRDGVQIARLEPADVVTGVSAYTWVDVAAAPAVDHVYELRRLTVGVGRSKPRRAPLRIDPEGIWLLRSNGDSAVIDGVGIDQLKNLERRLIYTPVHIPYAVDILTGYEGLSGPVLGSVEDDDDQTVHHAVRVLSAIKKNSTETVRLIYATVSKPVRLTDIDWQPDPDYRGDMNRHTVSFNVKQVGEFDFQVG